MISIFLSPKSTLVVSNKDGSPGKEQNGCMPPMLAEASPDVELIPFLLAIIERRRGVLDADFATTKA